MKASEAQPDLTRKSILHRVLTRARRAKAPILLTVTVIAAWWISVLGDATLKLLAGELEQSVATLLMGFFATFAVLLYIALFLLIPGSLYIWAVRRAGQKLGDEQWNTALPKAVICVLALLYGALVAISVVLFGHWFEVDELDNYTSFFSMPVQIYYELRAMFPYLGSMLIATPLWAFAYKWAKRRQHAKLRS